MVLLDGKLVAKELTKELKEKTATFARPPKLCIVRVGEDPEAVSYCRGAKKRMEKCGIDCEEKVFDAEISNARFQGAFYQLNIDEGIDGIIVMTPLPKQINYFETLRNLKPEKDMDCQTDHNRVLLYEGLQGLRPCTPTSVLTILRHYEIPLFGKHVVLVGRSIRVGKPLSHMMLAENATVTVCHSKTENLREITKTADVLVVAIGKDSFIDASYVKEGAAVVDVGINVREDGTIHGDVDFESVSEVASYLTPVPGGVGSVTTSVLALQVV